MSAEEGKRICAETEKILQETYGLVKEKELGKGQFGTVYCAVDASGRKHAVKLCVKAVLDKDAVIKNVLLMRELKVLESLNHPNVVKLINAVTLPFCQVFDMECCDMALDKYLIKKGGKLAEPVFKSLAKQLTAAIDYLHSNRIVHRDIKPANILLCFGPSGSFIAKLADFGFAKQQTPDVILKTSLGSPRFEAPEVFSAKTGNPYTNKCDLWSLGVTYYYILAKDYPFTKIGGLNAFLENKKYTVFDLPDSLKVSDSCKHFVRNHLMRDPSCRISADEAMRHPFLLPKLRVMQMTAPVNGAELVKPLVTDVDLSEIVFDHAKKTLGDKLTFPHAFDEELTVQWRDVAKHMGMDDKSIDDICVVCDEGAFFGPDDRVPVNNRDDSHELNALFISASNGVLCSEIKPRIDVHDFTAVLHDIEAMEADESKRSSLDLFNKYYAGLCSKYFKYCQRYVTECEMIRINCQEMQTFAGIVFVFEKLFSKIRSLQQQLVKKCPEFPKASFFPPSVGSSLEIVPPCSALSGKIEQIEQELKKIFSSTQKKADFRNNDMRAEICAIAELWKNSSDLETQCKQAYTDSCTCLNAVIQSFSSDAEVVSRLFRYIRALEKATKEDDATVVYPELRALLLDCDYLTVSVKSQNLLKLPTLEERLAAAKDAYIGALEAKVKWLEGAFDEVEKDRFSLAAEATETINSQSAVIERLRQILRDHNIHDPTM